MQQNPSTQIELFQEPTGSGWAAVPTNSGRLRGKRVKFSAGEYLCGETVMNGAELAAIDVETLWLKWQGGKIVETRVTKTGSPHPARQHLSDLDETEWEAGLDGKPVDPWRDARNLFLVDPATGEELTFTTDSIGGRVAVMELARRVASVRTKRPKATPLIKLAVVRWQTKFGMKPRPFFEIVAWAGTDVEDAPKSALADQLSDDLPF